MTLVVAGVPQAEPGHQPSIVVLVALGVGAIIRVDPRTLVADAPPSRLQSHQARATALELGQVVRATGGVNTPLRYRGVHMLVRRGLTRRAPGWASFIADEWARPRSAACAASGVVHAVNV